jgi:hypothetical protein
MRLESVLWVVVLVPLACADPYVDDDEGAVALTEIPFERTKTIPVRQGFINGKAVEFYRMGTFVPADSGWFPSFESFPGMPVGEMFVWLTYEGGNPVLKLDHPQKPIIDTLPKQAHYSDFFELVGVDAPDGYNANDIKSRATLLRAGYDLVYAGRIVNCPLVGPKAKLEPPKKGKAMAEYPLVEVWYRGQTVQCLLMDGGAHLTDKGGKVFKTFGTAITPEKKEFRVAATDVYTLITGAFTGADRVSNIPVPSNDVFRHTPDSPGYSPLTKIWDVTVPSDYQVGQVVSYDDLFPIPGFTDPRIEERSPEAFCNCPIARVGN